MAATGESSYRPDIDGLRAIAVLAVVGYHAFPQVLSGGFTGVDIFFVISGYLISGILLRELEQHRFSLAGFYARRARRIFPALTLVLVACLVFGWAALLSDEFTQLGKHVFAGAAFIANIVSWREAGYFDEAAELKPLLHLWSLGIEEQFYMAWPLLLLLTRRAAVPAYVMTGGVIAASFALNVFLVESRPVATFYLPFTRFWELAVGGFLASREFHRGAAPGAASKVAANVKALLGLVLVGASLLWLNEHKPFPGAWAALPTLGAALLISASRGAWLNEHLLGSRVLVFVGLVSYPFYLWHWPLLSFRRIVWPADTSLAVTLGLVLLAFLLSWLTYRFVEQPIRHESAWKTRPRLALLVSGIAIAVLVGAVISQQLIPVRLEKQDALVKQSEQLDKGQRASSGATRCEGLPEIGDSVRPFCASLGDGARNGTFVVWGDSHAYAWSPVFFDIAKQTGMRVIVFSVEGCPPLVGARRSDGHSRYCGSFGLAEQILESIRLLGPQHVFLVARWSLYEHGWHVNHRLQKATHFLTTDKDGHADAETSRKALATQLDATLRLLQGAPVTIVRTVPVLSWPPRVGLIRDPEGFEPTLAQHKAFEAHGDALIDQAVQAHHQVDAIDPSRLLCREKCRAVVDGSVIYSDDNHLTAQGALLFKPPLLQRLTNLSPPPR